MALDKRPMIVSEDSSQLSSEFHDWFWFKPSTGEMHRYRNGAWEVESTLLRVGNGLNFTHDGDKMEISKLVIVNGLITELECET